MDIISLLNDFLKLIEEDKVEIYNEFSLQHELGIFLRDRLPDYKVQFERNAKFFGITGTVKHEIDIVIYDDTYRCAIELKFPLNGQYPEQMYSFVKDIKFMEEMKESGFDETYCFSIVEDRNFYSGEKVDGIYSFFRAGTKIKGTIDKPTGKKPEQIQLNGVYEVAWKNCGTRCYYLVKI